MSFTNIILIRLLLKNRNLEIIYSMPIKQAHKVKKTARDKKALIAIYVARDVHAGLKKLADQDGRTLSNYLNRILSPVTNT